MQYKKWRKYQGYSDTFGRISELSMILSCFRLHNLVSCVLFLVSCLLINDSQDPYWGIMRMFIMLLKLRFYTL